MAFLVNEPVTQSDLNNIAVDLGDAEFSAFSSNKFGVDALNAITADLVTSGVLRTLDKCKPTLTNGNVNIAKGIIVFSDGAKLRITSPVSITAVANAYVAARYDSTNGICSIVSKAEIPTETGVEYMKLARVNTDCTAVTDLRTMANDKKAAYTQASKNVVLEVEINDLKYIDTDKYIKQITFSEYPELPDNFYPQYIVAPIYGHGAPWRNFIELPETYNTYSTELDVISGYYHLKFSRVEGGINIHCTYEGLMDDHNHNATIRII